MLQDNHVHLVDQEEVGGLCSSCLSNVARCLLLVTCCFLFVFVVLVITVAVAIAVRLWLWLRL